MSAEGRAADDARDVADDVVADARHLFGVPDEPYGLRRAVLLVRGHGVKRLATDAAVTDTPMMSNTIPSRIKNGQKPQMP